MIKLQLGKGLAETMAYCSFCGEDNKKPCVRGSVPFTADTVTTKMQWVIDDFDFRFKSFFSPNVIKVIKGDPHFREVVTAHNRDVELDSADICHDCIKQLAKLI